MIRWLKRFLSKHTPPRRPGTCYGETVWDSEKDLADFTTNYWIWTGRSWIRGVDLRISSISMRWRDWKRRALP